MKKFLFVVLLFTFSGFLSAQEITVYVASDLIKCGGNLDVMCLQVKDSPEKKYDSFVTNIEGFTFEEGYEYELLVYRGYHENPPSTAPAVYYTLRKIISKKTPRVTLEIANRKTICEDIKMFECIMYREKGEKEWHNLYGKIKGFKYREGYEYELLVSKELNLNMGAGMTYTYKLIKTLSKKPTMIISAANREFIQGRKFTLTGYRDISGFEKTIKSNKPVTLIFNLNENSVGGSDGCNQIGGRVEINNSSMKFVSMMGTKMFCQGVTVDRIVDVSLDKVTKYKLSGNTLKLYNGKTLLLEYEAIMEDVMPEKKQ